MSDAAVPSDPPSESAGAEAQGDPHVGTAYAVVVRSDADPQRPGARQTVLTFRVRRLAADGTLLPPVAVELRGAVLMGMVTDGDLVRLPEPAPHGGALQPSRVDNLTTRSAVVARPQPQMLWGLVIGAIAVLLVLGALLLGLIV